MRAQVKYEYTVSGTRYFGDRISFDFWPNESEQTSRYPVGRRVEVRYDPADPRSAILEPGGHNGLALVGLAVVIAVGVVVKFSG